MSREGNFVLALGEKNTRVKKKKGENTDSAGSLVPVVLVVRAYFADLIQVVFEVPRRVNLQRGEEGEERTHEAPMRVSA